MIPFSTGHPQSAWQTRPGPRALYLWQPPTETISPAPRPTPSADATPMYWRPTQSIPSPPLLLSRQPMLRGQFIPRYRKAIPPTSYSDTRERVGVRAQIALLHLVTSNVPRIGMTESLWDDLYFTSKGGVTCNAVTCAKCQTASLHHIRFTVHVLMDLTIDVSLALDHDADLMGPFTICDADVEPLCVRKMIFFPTHFFRPLPSAVPDNHGDVYPSPRRHHRRGSRCGLSYDCGLAL